VVVFLLFCCIMVVCSSSFYSCLCNVTMTTVHYPLSLPGSLPIYLDASGKSFRNFMTGNLDILPGETPIMSDFEDHLSTIFPEVRLKQFLEMRGADTGPWDELCALPAYWVGLLYDDAALDACLDLVKDWSADDRQKLREDVPAQGFDAMIHGRSVRDIARDTLAISRTALNKRGYMNGHGENETVFLQALDAMVRSGQSNADVLIAAYNDEWGGDISRCYSECIY